MTMEKDFQIRKVELNENKEKVIVDYFPNTKSKNVKFNDGKTLQEKYDNGELGSGETDAALGNHIANTTVHINSSERVKWNAAEQNSKAYTDRKVADLVNGAPESLDTLKELADAMGQHNGAYESLLAEVGKKSDKGHKHTKADITDFPTSLPANGGNADTVDGYHAKDFLNVNTGGNVNGALTVSAANRSGIGIQARNGSIYTNKSFQLQNMEGAGVDVANVWFDTRSGKNVQFSNVADISLDNKKVYHEGRKPTWDDIGNKPTTLPPSQHNHDNAYLKLSGGVLSGTDATRLTLKREGSQANNNLCFDGSGNKNYLGVSNGILKYGNTEDLGSGGKAIYHEGKKPTPAEIGAAAASHGTHVSYGTTTAGLTQGAGGVAGTSASVSRGDHTHSLPAYPTLASLGAAPSSHTHNDLTQRVVLNGQCQKASYRRSVIALCELRGVNTSFDSYSIGKLTFHRMNGLSGAIFADIAVEDQYGGDMVMNGSLLESTTSGSMRLCTFIYNGKNYGGLEFMFSDAEYGHVNFVGVTNFKIFALDYDDTRAGQPVLIKEVKDSLNFTTKVAKMGTLKYNANKIYHEGFKPTAVDVGARPSNWVPTWNDVSGKPSTFAPIIGSASNQAAAGNHNHNENYSPLSSGSGAMLSGQGTSNANDPSMTTCFRYLNPSSTGKPEGTDHALLTMAYNNTWKTQLSQDWRTNNAYIRACNNGTWSSWAKLYTTNNKPTATDVGARPSNWVPHWNDVTNKPMTFGPSANPTSINVDTAQSGIWPSLSSSSTGTKPGGIHNGNAFLSFHTHSGNYCSQLWFNTNSNKIHFRNRNNGNWTGWQDIYHSGNKPSLTDLGAAPTSHTHDDRYYTEAEVNSKISSHEQDFSGTDSSTYIAYPKDGRWRHKTSTSTGYLKITLPQSWTNTMLRFTVDIYEYRTNSSASYVIGGYNYNGGSGTWANNPFAYCISHKDGDKRNLTVRLGHDGSKCAVYIGEANSAWSYVQVTVKDITVGYSSNELSKWNSGWGVGVTTTLGTITSTISNTFVGNGGAARTAERLQTARTISGVSFDGSANISLNAGHVGARPSNWVPSWNDVTGKPTTFAPIIGSASNQAAAGNHTHNLILGEYTSSGTQTPANLGSNKLKLNMLNSATSGLGGWSDVLWMSSYAGGDVKLSNALVMSKAGARIGFKQANFDATSWGATYEIYHTGKKPTAADVGAAPASHSHSNYMSSGGTYGTITLSDWIRTSGSTGWYNSTYGGGMHMTDSTWVKVYNNKALLCSNIIKSSNSFHVDVEGTGDIGKGFVCNHKTGGMGYLAKNESSLTLVNRKAGVALSILDNGDIKKVNLGSDQSLIVHGHQSIYNFNRANDYLHVGADNGAYGVSWWASDMKLKHEITQLSGSSMFSIPLKLKSTAKRTPNRCSGLDIISKINHYSFKYNDIDFINSDGKNVVEKGASINCGYIGQQLEEIDKSLVIRVEQEEGKYLYNENDPVIRQPDYRTLIPYITKAIQEQQEIIRTQENMVVVLEERIRKIEEKLSLS